MTSRREPLLVGWAAVLLTAHAWLAATQAASPPPAAERAEDDHYRALFGRFRAQLVDALKAGNHGEVARLADEFNRSVDGRLLYLRVIHIDQYVPDAGRDAPGKTTALVDKPFSAWRVAIPKMRLAFAAEPQITRHAQDHRTYVVIENGRREGGRYDGDLAIMMAIGTRKPGEWPKGPPAVQHVVALLELPWQEKLSDAKLDEAAASLQPAADEAVEEIMRAFNRSGQTFAYRHRAVQILQRLNTSKARATLLEIALGRSAEDLPSMKQWASAAYVRTTQDYCEVRKLLASADSGVLGNALRALKGAEVDEALLKRLLELTAHKDKEPMSQEGVRRLAAMVMAADPGGEFVAEKVDAILAAVGDVANLPHAGKVHWPGSYTYAESSYQHYLTCLSQMPGADAALRQATGRATGVAREILVLARAQRGDATARQDLHRILDDPQAGMRRAWAARGLAVIGTEEDLPLLKKLADSDPMERDRGGDVGPPGQKNTYFPVREAAREALRKMQSRLRTPP